MNRITKPLNKTILMKLITLKPTTILVFAIFYIFLALNSIMQVDISILEHVTSTKSDQEKFILIQKY